MKNTLITFIHHVFEKFYKMINAVVWLIVDALFAPFLAMQIIIQQMTDWGVEKNFLVLLLMLGWILITHVALIWVSLNMLPIYTIGLQLTFIVTYVYMVFSMLSEKTFHVEINNAIVIVTLMNIVIFESVVVAFSLFVIALLGIIITNNLWAVCDGLYGVLDYLLYVPNLLLKVALQPLRLLNIYHYIICPAALYSFQQEAVIDHKATANVITFSLPGMLGTITQNVARFNAVENGFQVFFAHKAMFNKTTVLDHYRQRIQTYLMQHPERNVIYFKGFSLGGFIMQLVYEHCLKDPWLNDRLGNAASVVVTLEKTFHSLPDVVSGNRLPMSGGLLQYTHWYRESPVELEYASVVKIVSKQDEIIPTSTQSNYSGLYVDDGTHHDRFNLGPR